MEWRYEGSINSRI